MIVQPPEVLQGPIEFGHVLKDRGEPADPCVGPRTHVMNLPMNLLYWGVPADQVPQLPGGIWPLDLFDILEEVVRPSAQRISSLCHAPATSDALAA